MEKGPSTFAEYWTSPENQDKHYLEHGRQMGFDNDRYGFNEAAKDLALSEDGETLAFVRKNDECICKFNTKTRHFIVLNRNGKIISFYKASLKYFLNEFHKKGLYSLKGDLK